MQREPGKKRRAALQRLQERLGMQFSSFSLLHQALIHKSFANEHGMPGFDNERLEFLGDAVLELVTSEYLYRHYPQALEGEMARMRSAVVCEPVLAAKARELGLGEFLLLGKGEEMAGGRNRDSLLSDALEAVIGAMYLEGDYASCRRFVLELLAGDVQRVWETKGFIDPKSALQEVLQQQGQSPPSYDVYKEQGPDHDKVFHVVVAWEGQILGKGRGKTKKEAEQQAAGRALRRFRRRNSPPD